MYTGGFDSLQDLDQQDMRCTECQQEAASSTLNGVDLCGACAERLGPKLRQLGRMFDEVREDQRSNMRMYGNREGTIDRDEYWGRRGTGL